MCNENSYSECPDEPKTTTPPACIDVEERCNSRSGTWSSESRSCFLQLDSAARDAVDAYQFCAGIALSKFVGRLPVLKSSAISDALLAEADKAADLSWIWIAAYHKTADEFVWIADASMTSIGYATMGNGCVYATVVYFLLPQKRNLL